MRLSGWRLVLLLAAAHILNAQEFRSTITGRVTDQTGAVVPGAKIEAVQVETGARFASVAGHDGEYTLPFLNPGSYRISAEAPGLKRYVQEGVTINANEHKGIDIRLEVGGVAETVTVTSDAPILNTVTGSLGKLVTSAEVSNIPMNGRSPLMMAQLWAGVSPNGGPALSRPIDLSHTSDFSVGGTESANNELLLDGAPNMFRGGTSAYSPPMDAVLELRVEGFQADAAYGSTGGGTVNIVSKAGTNQYHGSVYEFNQVGRLAATNFFVNRSGQKKPFSLYNQFGANVGGPVSIPKVFDGRNRLLVFFAYEGLRQPNPLGQTSTVPTAEERKGDFSKLLAVGQNYQIFDPFSAVAESGRVRRQPLPNNVIPARLLNPVALNYLQYFPLPNQPGGVDGKNNLYSVAPQVDNFNNFMGRLDYNLSANHKLFLQGRQSARQSFEKAWFNNVARGRYKLRDGYGLLLDDVYTLNPTTVLNVRLNWTRYIEVHHLQTQGMDLTAFGFPQYITAASPFIELPKVTWSNYTQLGESNANTTPFDSYQIFSNVVKVVGPHSLKFGADLRRYRESNYNPSNAAGSYSFNTNWTRGPLDSASSSPIGQDFASFLLGLPTGGSFDLNAFRSNQSGYYALFLQDDWRVRSDLTLNGGIRWEKEMPVTERFNRLEAGFDPAAALSITAAAKAAYAKSPIPQLPAAAFNPVGGLLFTSADHRRAYGTESNHFSPRLGFAWTPRALGGRTVIRGGGGIFYYNLGITGTDQTGFSQSTPFVATQDGYLTPYATLSNPFPAGIQRAPGAALGVNTNLGQSVSYFNPNPSTPYTVRFNLNLQRQLSQNTVAEIGWLMNHSVHLGVDRQLNYVPAQFLSTTGVRDQATIDLLSASVPNPFAGLMPSGLNGSVVARSQLLKPFPQYTGVTAEQLSDGSLYSHMLVARIEKRLSGGLQFQSNFEYSRVMQKLDRLNDSDPAPYKRVSSTDRPLRLVTSGIYSLPFGKGAGRAARQFLGGWMISGVYVAQAGPPVEWSDSIYLGGDLHWSPGNIDGAFDTTRFVTNSRQQLGSNIRTFPIAFSNLRAPAISSLDAAVIKDFPIRERLKLQYRCEWFNALNHPIFDAPDVSPTSSTFGKTQSQINLPRSVQMSLKLAW